MSGACGPSYNKRWSGSGQRSFEKWAEQVSRNMWFPVDVEETAQEYTFVADVPGLGKNDIKVYRTTCCHVESLRKLLHLVAAMFRGIEPPVGLTKLYFVTGSGQQG